MNRVYNFSADPSVLPLEVLKGAQDELLCYKDSDISVMEMSHISEACQEIFDIAMPKAGVEKLSQSMAEFERSN